jgi:apolipoprotein D and lipocalin family protein
MPNRTIGVLMAIAMALAGCTAIPKGLTPVGDFKPDRYMGKWYEIARLDHSFERNLSNVSATYWKKDNDDIGVENRGFDTEKGVWKRIEGRARFLGDTDVGSLKVSFFGPFYGGYHIIELEEKQYQYAMVAGPSRDYLWILARTKMIDPVIYDQLVTKAKAWGFATDQLIRVVHDRPDA